MNILIALVIIVVLLCSRAFVKWFMNNTDCGMYIQGFIWGVKWFIRNYQSIKDMDIWQWLNQMNDDFEEAFENGEFDEAL